MKQSFDDFEFDTEELELRRDGSVIRVEPMALRVLELLLRSPGRLVTKQELVTHVWGGRVVAENVITVTMVRLRKALGHRPGGAEFVNNVHGRGYRFVRPVVQQPTEPLPPPAAPRIPQPPFVGRARLLEALRQAHAEASRGRGNAAVLSGEPGIGKTRALEEFEQELNAAGGWIAWGHCRESGDTPPLWPFAQILRRVIARISKRDPSFEPAAWIARAPELAFLLPEHAGSIDPASLDAAGGGGHTWEPLSKHRVFDTITQLFAHAASQGMCVLVLDDLHRADAASLELLQFWIDRLPHTGILLLATLNRLDLDAGASRAHLAYFYGHRNTARFAVQRLSPADVSDYVGAVIEDSSGELAREIYDRSEGNPFFMSELTRGLRDAEHAQPSALALPLVALELVRRRLEILDEEARGALSWAAVIGRRFELPLLQAVTEQSAAELMAIMDRASAHDVVQSQPDSPTSFRFGHELLRVALYERLVPSRRRELHLRIASALEQRMKDGTAAVAVADLAFHFHAAIPASDLQKTVKHCGRAAKESASLFAYSDTLRYLRHARQALELQARPDAQLRLKLLMREAQCARLCGDPQAEPLARQIIQRAREQGNGTYLAWGAFLLDLNTGFPPLAGSREALEAALEALPDDDAAMRSAVLARLAATAPLAYEAQRSYQQVAQAVELAERSGAILALYVAHSAQLYLTGSALDPAIADASVRKLEQLYQEHPRRLTVPPILLDFHRGIVALQAGDLRALDDALERCAAACRRLDHRELRWHIERAQAVQRFNAGDTLTAIERLRALHEQGEQAGWPGSALFRAYDQCVISPEVAWLSRAELRSALERDSADRPNIWSMKVRALASAGLYEEARAQLRTVSPEGLRDLPRDRDYLGTLGALVHAILELGADEYRESLRALLGEYPERFAAHGSFLCEGSVAQLLGLLARSSGRVVEAAREFARGARLAEQVRLVRAAADSRKLLGASG